MKVISIKNALSKISHKQPIKEVLVFSTSIQNKEDVDYIRDIFDNLAGILSWSVDMEDWEKVLRVESIGLQSSFIVEILKSKGVHIKEMV